MDGHMKAKTFDKDKLYVVNHELDTIYNDLRKFDKKDMEGALAQFLKFADKDTTILVRGSDGKIVK